jgi:eukaryotic-like serine/threonine-protein kinase
MALDVGDRLGQYELREQLGRGGMAVVFRAYQPSLEREVAIKVLQNATGDPDFVERFRREARSISRLRHPNILTVYDFGEQDGLAYMVGELVGGGTLAERLGQPLPFQWVGVCLAAVASALDYAHESGLIHRDVKPSNILMTEADLPILSDFGVAKLLQEGVAHLTGSGMVVGTPEYMAPEQALGQEVGPPCDIYSLGVVLYQMVVGQVPYAGPSPVAVALAHVNSPLPPPRQLNPELPVAIERVLLKVLLKEPSERHQTASELALDFAEAARLDARELYESAGLTFPNLPRPITPGGGIPRPATPQRGLPRPATPGSGTPNVAPPGPALPRPATPGAGTPRPAAPYPGFVQPVTPPAATPRPVLGEPPRTAVRPVIRPERSGGRLGLLIGVIVALLILGGLVVALLKLQPWSTPAQQAVVTPTAAEVVVVPIQASPTAAAAPVATLAPVPTVTATLAPTPTVAATPTTALKLAPDGKLAARIGRPINGDRVPESFVVHGTLDRPLAADQHLWVMVRPRQGPDNWWAVEQEIHPTPNNEWDSKVYLGGEPGLFHRLALGVADPTGESTIVKHLAEHPGEPFERGLPAGFTTLDEISVEKQGG